MTPEFTRLVKLVEAYLATGDYMTLWSPIAGNIFADREPGPFAPAEEPLWEELYDAVYMGQQDSATPGEAKHGLVGGKELRARLSDWHSRALGAQSA